MKVLKKSNLFLVAALIFLGGVNLESQKAFSQTDLNVEEGFFEEEPSSDVLLEEVPPPEVVSPNPNAKSESSPINKTKTQKAAAPPVVFEQEDTEPLPQISKEPRPIEAPLVRPEEQKIKHPLIEKGLRRIKADGTYLFEKEPSPQKHGVSVRFGLYEPLNLENPQNGESFQNNYGGQTNAMILIDYEWQFWKMALGKFAFKFGSGVFLANGNGRFANDFEENRGLTPLEGFTFIALPNSAGIAYRMQWSDYQILVPYGSGGIMGFTFAEIRDDEGGPKFGLSPAAYASGGLALNLTGLSRSSARLLDFEYGINGAYLVGEWKSIFTLGGDFDFSASFVNFGFLIEY